VRNFGGENYEKITTYMTKRGETKIKLILEKYAVLLENLLESCYFNSKDTEMSTILSQNCKCQVFWCGGVCCGVDCWAGACVWECNNENSDIPVDDREQLYGTVQQCQMNCLNFCSYTSLLFPS
jgi:hypothetical protein